MLNKIIILHGWASNIKNWNPVKNGLEKEGFQVFLPVLPGFSDKKIYSGWDLQAYCDWLSDYLQKQKINSYYLLGHSFGGRIAIKFSSSRLAKGLQGLILINSAGIEKGGGIKKAFFYILAKLGKIIFFLPPFCFFKKFGKWFLYKLAGEKDYYKASRVMKQTMKKTIKEDLTKILKKIKVQVLLIWGKNDKQTPLKNGYLMEKKIPNAKMIVLPDSKHDLPFKKTTTMIKYIKEFINK